MTLANILRHSSTIFGDTVLFQFSTHDNHLTYSSSWQIAQRHAEYTYNKITDLKLLDNATTRRYSSISVVVAYLVQHNCPDFLLSIFGTCICCEILKQKWPVVHLVPTLLNARWTPHDIFCAIKVNDNTSQLHVTVILYGDDMEAKAYSAKELMLGDKNHCVVVDALPKISTLKPDVLGARIQERLNMGEETRGKMNSGYTMDGELILFTSGSTGRPKGVRLSHSALFIQAAAKALPPCNYSRFMCMVASTVPFFHVGGLNSALAVVLAGGSFCFPPSQRQPQQQITAGRVFQPQSVLDCVQYKSSVDTLVMVPAMLNAIFAYVDRKKYTGNYEQIRLVLIGGQSLSGKQLSRTITLFPEACIVQTYACTEAASSITFSQLHPITATRIQHRENVLHAVRNGGISSKLSNNNGDSVIDYADYVGIPPPHVDLATVVYCNGDGINGRKLVFLEPYQVGWIATRGPHVMKGYWDRSVIEGSKEMRIDTNWHVTSDMGFLDDNGGLYFCGRTSDVIRTGGETVIATEVEHVLRMMPIIDDCAVFAFPDKEQWGEVVAVAIVLKNDLTQKYAFLNGDSGFALSSEKYLILKDLIRNHCIQQKLTSYKRPKMILVIDELPRNSSGKVLKHKLKQLATRTKGATIDSERTGSKL